MAYWIFMTFGGRRKSGGCAGFSWVGTPALGSITVRPAASNALVARDATANPCMAAIAVM